jgi:hypothetical protein
MPAVVLAVAIVLVAAEPFPHGATLLAVRFWQLRRTTVSNLATSPQSFCCCSPPAS